MKQADGNNAFQILIVAPAGNDATNAAQVLRQAGMAATICDSLTELCETLPKGAGAALIAAEALTPAETPHLISVLASQPTWSDLPLLVITGGGELAEAMQRAFNIFSPNGNVGLLERPLSRLGLVSSLQVALRARKRQYQVRGLLEEQGQTSARLQSALEALQQSQEELRRYAQELENRVEERTARLKQTIDELEAFSYSVSHDLRAPLRAMQGFSQFLEEDYGDKLDETGRDYVNRIARAASRLDQLVQDILTYSRVARMDLHVKPINLEKLIREVIQAYPALHATAAKIDIKTPLLDVIGHEGSLTQCVSNLLTNAVKFVPASRHPEVTIWTESRGHCVCIYFQDNGIGIAPEHQERIFKMFEKAPQKEAYEGTGIGLAIVRKAVERMDGEVGVESALGSGSKFWIKLPQAKEKYETNSSGRG